MTWIIDKEVIYTLLISDVGTSDAILDTRVGLTAVIVNITLTTLSVSHKNLLQNGSVVACEHGGSKLSTSVFFIGKFLRPMSQVARSRKFIGHGFIQNFFFKRFNN